MPSWIDRPSPNYNHRPGNTVVHAIVLHADAGDSVGSTLSWLLTPASKVSYHLLISRAGTVYQVVDPSLRAWHAGVSAMRGENDCNNYSVGVCLQNNQTTQSGDYPEVQLAAAVDVCAELMRRYPAIAPANITTHALVALPAGRKHDPAQFDLSTFVERVKGVPHA